MTWKDRIAKNIILISPIGTEFTAFWRGGPRDAEKSLGIFKSPGVPGSIVQDLDRSAITYTIVIIFEGADNDLQADKFFQECGSTRGVWTVIHPVKGRLKLQLVSYSEAIEPITDGNLTSINTVWLEPRIESTATTSSGAAALAVKGISNVNETARSQFVENVFQNIYEETAQIRIRTNQILDIYNSTLSNYVAQSASVKARIDTIKAQINDTLTEPLIITDDLAGQLRAIMQIPATISGNIESVIALYNSFFVEVLSLKNGGDTVDPNVLLTLNKNKALIDEMMIVSGLGALTENVVNGQLITRKQTIELSDTINNSFQLVTGALDEYQQVFEDGFIETQYFSQSQSYNDCVTMLTNTVNYLILSSFSLKIEKRVTLLEPKTPVFIALEQYGNVDEIDFFIESNDLKANDIMLLPANREVLIYT